MDSNDDCVGLNVNRHMGIVFERGMITYYSMTPDRRLYTLYINIYHSEQRIKGEESRMEYELIKGGKRTK